MQHVRWRNAERVGGLKQKIESVLGKLEKLQEETSDRYNTTPAILQSITNFIGMDLEKVITELAEIRDEIEEAESDDDA